MAAADPSDILRWNLLQRKAQEWRIVRSFALLREQAIEPILIKGWAAGLYYPASQVRPSIDTDLAVSARDFPAAEEISKSAAGEGLAIDLHCELRHLDTVSWSDLFENSVCIDVDGNPIRVLRVEDHLRVLCVHWLTDGGANKEKLWDIYHMVQNRPANFDWTRFLDSVPLHRRQWLVCCVGLAAKYLRLDIKNTPIAAEASRLPDWLIKTLEKEWASKTKHVPLELAIRDPKILAAQIRKRIRPNPIWATIQMEGNLNSRTRIFYQCGSVLKRIIPSARRVLGAIKQIPR